MLKYGCKGSAFRRYMQANSEDNSLALRIFVQFCCGSGENVVSLQGFYGRIVLVRKNLR